MSKYVQGYLNSAYLHSYLTDWGRRGLRLIGGRLEVLIAHVAFAATEMHFLRGRLRRDALFFVPTVQIVQPTSRLVYPGGAY